VGAPSLGAQPHPRPPAPAQPAAPEPEDPADGDDASARFSLLELD
jgi:hypothetical protein